MSSSCECCSRRRDLVWVPYGNHLWVKESDYKTLEARVTYLERLLDRAYPWLHNPYHGTTDFANAAEGDAVIEAVQFAIQHVAEEPDPLLKLPCGSCDGDGCPNCEAPKTPQ